MMFELFKTFANDESGAVTVDWVVLTAALVGLAIAVIAVLAPGLTTTSGVLNSQLESQTIRTTFD